MVTFTLHYHTTIKKYIYKAQGSWCEIQCLRPVGSTLLFELHPLLLLLGWTVLAIPQAHRALLRLWAFAQTIPLIQSAHLPRCLPDNPSLILLTCHWVWNQSHSSPWPARLLAVFLVHRWPACSPFGKSSFRAPSCLGLSWRLSLCLEPSRAIPPIASGF